MSAMCFYGSLRNGQYNNQRIKQIFPNGIKYISSKKLSGFKMYSLYHYPAICKTNREEDKIIVEIYDVSQEVLDYIRAMELGAGYTESTVEEAIIYIMNEEQLTGYDIVKNGDWVNYKKYSK